MKQNELRPYNKTLSSTSEAKQLYSWLPMPLPYSMLIDPSNLCNFRCAFCPTGDHELLKTIGRPQGTMKYDLFCKIIDDIHEMVDLSGHKIKRLHLYKDGEPLINKRFIDMVRYAVSSGVAESIETTTNGSLLSQKLAVDLIEAGIDLIRISIEGVSEADYKEITQTYSNYNKIKENVATLFEEKECRKSPMKIHAKIIDLDYSDEKKEKFMSDFTPISDSINIDNLMGWSNSDIKDWTLGLDVTKGMDGVSSVGDRMVCPEPFSKLSVNFDGQVSACCVDWSYGTIVGDLNRQSLMEIWNGDQLRQFRLIHLNGERKKIKACKDCKFLSGLPDYSNLDDHTDRLIKMFS